MKLDESKFRKTHGYEEGKDVLDPSSIAKAADYKKNVLKNFTSISQHEVRDRLTGTDYRVTRKYDGEYAIIFYSHGQTVTVNRSGRTRRGIPCIEEAGELLAAAGIKEGIFPAEIYVDAEYKTRVNDLISALGSKGDINTLRLAVFDILEIDGKTLRGPYEGKWEEINRIFGAGTLCHPVDMVRCGTGQEIQEIWNRWVDAENSEGLIVHTPMTIYKVKPRHFFDAVVIAYGEGSGKERGQVRRMLFAFMPGPHQYQIMSRVGSGLNEKLRRELFRFFTGKEVPNPVRGINDKWDDLVFVKPELVIEVAVEEIVTELASGEKTNHLLYFNGSAYEYKGIVPGYRTYTPVFIRLREDKSPDENDAGTGQIDRYLSGGERQPVSRNTILLRDILLNHAEGTSVTYTFWQRPDSTLTLVRSHRRHGVTDRVIFNDEPLFELYNRYGQMAGEDLRRGYCRDNDELILTDEFHYLMQTEEEPQYY